MNNITLRRRPGKIAMKFSEGDIVEILGRKTVLQNSLGLQYEGGWRVDPKIDDCGFWNEQEMKRVKRR